MGLNRRHLAKWSVLPQLLAHQIAWWTCVLAQGWVGPGVMLVFIGVHLWVMRSHWRPELALVVLSTGLGIGLDNALAQMGDVQYQGTVLVGLAPLWLVAIWAGFGATVRHSQSAFFRNRWAALLTGVVGGPMAYWGGERLGVLTVSSLIGWLDIGVLWAAAMLTLEGATRRMR